MATQVKKMLDDRSFYKVNEVCGWLAVFCCLFFSSCDYDSVEDQLEGPVVKDPNLREFIHLGHTRADADAERAVNTAIDLIDLAAYDLLLLGGDMAWNSSGDPDMLEELKTTFDLEAPSTLWALGNHDDADLGVILEATGRSGNYSYHHQGVTFIVLNTNESANIFTQEQLDLVASVTDTLSASSHLILLHHKLVWLYGHPEFESQIDEISNGNFGTCDFCLPVNNFYQDVYPLLLSVKNKGKGVLCIGGDLGNRVPTFESTTTDGIVLLGSGWNVKDREENPVLILAYHLVDKELSWSFTTVGEL